MVIEIKTIKAKKTRPETKKPGPQVRRSDPSKDVKDAAFGISRWLALSAAG
jgi:hypothetical protein